MILLAVAAAAFLGAAARAAITDLDGSFNRQLLGTIAVNVLGAFALGVLTTLEPSTNVIKVIGVGALGALTTFSTAIAQLECIGRERDTRSALGVGVASLALIVIAAWLGTRW